MTFFRIKSRDAEVLSHLIMLMETLHTKNRLIIFYSVWFFIHHFSNFINAKCHYPRFSDHEARWKSLQIQQKRRVKEGFFLLKLTMAVLHSFFVHTLLILLRTSRKAINLSKNLKMFIFLKRIYSCVPIIHNHYDTRKKYK